MELTNQAAVAHWSWTIAFFLWLVGLGGMGLFVNMWARSRAVFYVCTAAGIVGTLLVVSHLGRMLNLPFAVFYALKDWSFNFGSWMFIGICLLSVFCIWTLLQCLAFWKCPKYKKGEGFTESDWGYRVNGVLGLAVTAYSGFLLTQAEGIEFWTTAMIPTLWVVSGLSCGLGLVEFLIGTGRIKYDTVPWITKTSNVADSLEAVAIFALLCVAFGGGAASVAGAERMVCGEGALMFWGGAIFLGIVLPLAINLTVGKTNHQANIVGGASAIIGALFLRASVLMAGFFAPIYF
jgi:formate-dependent nitrite reductase membrane component NrfD